MRHRLALIVGATLALAVVITIAVVVAINRREPAPKMPASPAFSAEFLGQLQDPGTFPVFVTDPPAYRFPPNLAEPLRRLHIGWSAYMHQFEGQYPGLQDLIDRPVAAIEDDGSATYDAVCQIQTLPSPVPTSLQRPLYCRAVQVSPNTIPQTGLILLPVGFTERLRQTVANQPEDAKRWTAGMIAALYYQDHLTAEAANAGIIWPRGPLFDWCLVGISMRTLTKDTVVAQQIEPLLRLTAELIGPPLAPITTAQQLYQMSRGYVTGRPNACSYRSQDLPK